MANLIDLRNTRVEKLNKLESLGVDPYPARSFKTINNDKVKEKFAELEGKELSVSGRITSMRVFKNLAFIDLKDSGGKIQLYIKEDEMIAPEYRKSELGFSDLGLLDAGDFAEGKGIVTKTQTGEISVLVKKLRILAKSLRPMP